MKHKIIIFLAFIGFIGLMTSCEKDETRVVMLENPVAPELVTVPNLTLSRTNANDTLVFTGTAVDPGFTASVNYFLEACATGNGFDDVAQIYSGIQANTIKITVSDINGILIKKFPADQVSSVDFRIRAVLLVDEGRGKDPLEYVSETRTVNVTIFGLPKLDLIDSGMDQKIQSASGDGIYSGFVKLDPALAFTLYDSDAAISYGFDATSLIVDGTGINVEVSGYHALTANINDMTYSLDAYRIGLVGSATPNEWNSPDQKMDYNAASGTWTITLDLIVGDIKFRKNDEWSWNLGGTADNLTKDGANIPVAEAGNYTITLTITDDAAVTGTFKIVKN